MKTLLILLLSVSAGAARISRTSSSSSSCSSVKVLVIGGELQPNSWGDCSKESHGINSDWYKNKVAAEREEYRRRQEEGRERRKRDKKTNDCHGVGAASGCTGVNPGAAEGKVKKSK